MSQEPPTTPASPKPYPEDWQFSAVLDGGEKSCGDVAIELRLFLKDFPSGERFLLIARYPGVISDIPAYCRMTGNICIAQQYPYFLIQKK